MAILAGFYRVSGLGAYGGPVGIYGLCARLPLIQLAFTIPVGGPSDASFDGPPQACQEENDGLQLLVTVVDQAGNPINLRNATARQFLLRAPDGKVTELPAALYTTGLDGALSYVTSKTDITESGVYELQARYMIGGETQTSRRRKFRVGANLE